MWATRPARNAREWGPWHVGQARGAIPFAEDHLAGIQGIADHALWKRRGELVDEEVVLYVADSLPRLSWSEPG